LPETAETGGVRQAGVVAALSAVVIAPLVVATGALRTPRWYPVLDLAMTEYRVRDVFTRRTPLIGLPGRIGRTIAEQGSHPGPLSFYALAPLYRALGSSAWALQVGTVAIHSLAVVVCLAIARRRGGIGLTIAMAAVLAALTRGYGLSALTEPWNPYLPLLWWMVFLLSVWSVLAGDIALLPLGVLAASFCAQTHVPYLANTVALGGVAAAGAFVMFLRAARGSPKRRSVLRWSATAVLVGAVAWAPPVVDQLIHQPGNLSQLYRHFTDPPEAAVGMATGLRLALLHLDFFGIASGRNGATGSLVVASAEPTGSIVPGLAFFAVWLSSTLAAWRLRHRELIALHLTVAAALIAGAISMARIFGDLWYYLMLWAWGVTALAALGLGWTVVVLASRRVEWVRSPGLGRVGAATLVASTLIWSGWFSVDATHAQPPAPRLSSTLARVTTPTIKALESGVAGATGRSGRYVITWSDALHIGSEAYGLVSELERSGFRAGMTPGLHVPLTDYRTFAPGQATLEVHFATGTFVDQWRRIPVATEVVYVEPRTPAQQREFARLRARALDQLRARHLDDVATHVDDNLFGASIDRRVPTTTRRLLARMLDLGEPTAVFFAPAGTTP